MAKSKSCVNCLWCWPEIHGEEGYRCYNPQSPGYHRIPTYRCDKWEIHATPCSKGLEWDDPKLTYRKSRKGWYE